MRFLLFYAELLLLLLHTISSLDVFRMTDVAALRANIAGKIDDFCKTNLSSYYSNRCKERFLRRDIVFWLDGFYVISCEGVGGGKGASDTGVGDLPNYYRACD
jgi:hypothetical protein